ncbi:MAG: haloacid dehalogenase type II [Bosea sp. (in: a-proteobacteria)]
MTSKPFRAVVFDAYGTLFDVHAAVFRHSAAVGPQAQAVSELWRAKQLEYSWTRSLMGRYRDFWELTEAALDFALARFAIHDTELRGKLLAAYRELGAYHEVPRVLAELKARGLRTAILSNGSPDMLASAVTSAGLAPLLDAVISVHLLGTFKPPPRAYQPVLDQLGVSRDEVLFISSNRWDVAGATAFGFACLWCNRAGLPEEYADLPPLAVIADLSGIAAHLG